MFRHGLTKENALEIESALIDALGLPVGNLIRGYNASEKGRATLQELKNKYSATHVNPGGAYSRVFVFNIAKGLVLLKTEYEATRQAWTYCRLMNSGGGLAVGLKNGISQGVYVFKQWEDSPDNKIGKTPRYVFHAEERYDSASRIHHELLGKDWSKITISAGGMWNFGRYLVVEFNGTGGFRFLLPDRNTWDVL